MATRLCLAVFVLLATSCTTQEATNAAVGAAVGVTDGTALESESMDPKHQEVLAQTGLWAGGKTDATAATAAKFP